MGKYHPVRIHKTTKNVSALNSAPLTGCPLLSLPPLTSLRPHCPSGCFSTCLTSSHLMVIAQAVLSTGNSSPGSVSFKRLFKCHTLSKVYLPIEKCKHPSPDTTFLPLSYPPLHFFFFNFILSFI